MTTFHVDKDDAGHKKIAYKDEDDTTQIVLDWSKWLGSSTISSDAWEADSGLTLANDSNTTTTATNYVSGGSKGGNYNVKCTITTADSPARLESRTIEVRVVQKK